MIKFKTKAELKKENLEFSQSLKEFGNKFKLNTESKEDLDALPNNDSNTLLMCVFITFMLLLVVPFLINGFLRINVGLVMFLGPPVALVVFIIASKIIKR
jgi:hypothetical protein